MATWAQFKNILIKYFDTADLYDILKIKNDATESQVRKAYYRLSMLHHPDRCDEAKKEESAEKFKVISRIYKILSDKHARASYDVSGSCGFYDDLDDCDWLNYWRSIFKPLSKKDIEEYEKSYKDSADEVNDLLKAYKNGKGCMDHILKTVPFTSCEEEPRIRAIIQKHIDEGQLSPYDTFTNECPKKTRRRERKYKREAALAAKMASPADKDETGETALFDIIAKRQRDRGEEMNSFCDHLAEKYGCATPERLEGKRRKRK